MGLKNFFRKLFRKVLPESAPESVFQTELGLKTAIKPKNRSIYGYIGLFSAPKAPKNFAKH